MSFKKINSNKGFSLLELLVVMSVLAIMTAFAALGMAAANNADVGKSAHSLETAFNTSRVQCMSKGSDIGQITLVKNNGGLYYRLGDENFLTKICSRKIQFRIEYKSGAIALGDSIPDGDIATISFNSAGMILPSATPEIRRVVFINNNRMVETVLYGETGKHEVNLL